MWLLSVPVRPRNQEGTGSRINTRAPHGLVAHCAVFQWTLTIGSAIKGGVVIPTIPSRAAAQPDMRRSVAQVCFGVLRGQNGVEVYYLVNSKLFTLRFSPIVESCPFATPERSETRQCYVGRHMFPYLFTAFLSWRVEGTFDVIFMLIPKVGISGFRRDNPEWP